LMDSGIGTRGRESREALGPYLGHGFHLDMKLCQIISILALTVLLGCSTSVEKELFTSPTRDTYEHDGIRIHFKDLGIGRTIVFIHGFGASLDSWRFMVESLKNEYRLVLLDLKGHGYSDKPPDSRYSVRDQADIVIGLLEHLGVSNAVLVGHSFGSAVALLVALSAQESSSGIVSGLFLIAGSVDADNLPFALRLLRTPVIGWLAMKLTSASFRTRLALTKAYYDDEKITDSVVELYAKYQNIPGTDYAFLKTAEQLIPQDFIHLKQELRKLQIPLVNIWGERDEIIPRDSAEGVCKILPRCTFVTVDVVGHIPHEETPDKIVPLLRNFLYTH
ncbi:MAG: alpha/beta fold hydrolase, partial [Candidatus Binatia bacterium]